MVVLRAAVFVGGRVLLPGEEPEPALAARITNPGAWRDEPASGTQDDGSAGEGGSADEGPVEVPAKKTTVRRKAGGK